SRLGYSRYAWEFPGVSQQPPRPWPTCEACCPRILLGSPSAFRCINSPWWLRQFCLADIRALDLRTTSIWKGVNLRRAMQRWSKRRQRSLRFLAITSRRPTMHGRSSDWLPLTPEAFVARQSPINARRPGLLRLNTGRLNYFDPLFGFVANELAGT